MFYVSYLFHFDGLEIGGYDGQPNEWYVGNGRDAKISTSKDKKNWTLVGSIPYTYGASIINITLSKSTAKFIKFESNGLLGIGFLDIKKL